MILKTSAEKKDAADVDRIISKHYLFSSFWRIRHFHCALQQAPAASKNSNRIPWFLPTETFKPPPLIWHCRRGKVSKINQILATSLRSPLHAKQSSRECSDVGANKSPPLCQEPFLSLILVQMQQHFAERDLYNLFLSQMCHTFCCVKKQKRKNQRKYKGEPVRQRPRKKISTYHFRHLMSK